MEKNKKEILSKLNSIAKKSSWIEEAQKRQDKKELLEASQLISLKILRTLRQNKTHGTAPKTQVELSDMLGVQPQQVNKWVKGKENLKLDTLLKLQRILKIELLNLPKPQIDVVEHTKIFPLVFTKRNETRVRKYRSKLVSFKGVQEIDEPYYKVIGE